MLKNHILAVKTLRRKNLELKSVLTTLFADTPVNYTPPSQVAIRKQVGRRHGAAAVLGRRYGAFGSRAMHAAVEVKRGECGWIISKVNM